MSITANERAELCDLFQEVGPDAPTLCEGWSTRDLLAHMLVRERRPDAAIAIVVPFFREHAADVTKGIAAEPWETMIKTFREGPPLWSPWAIPVLGDKANLAEFFVHHEDVRRGTPGWTTRGADETRDGALWELVTRMGKMLYRRSPVGLAVRRPTGEQAVIKTGRGLVTVEGEPGEILLHGSGRDAVHVELHGQPADVAALTSASRGF